jgi:hypothetical protein
MNTPQGLRPNGATTIKQEGQRFVHDRSITPQLAQRRLAKTGDRELDFDAFMVAVGARCGTHFASRTLTVLTSTVNRPGI